MIPSESVSMKEAERQLRRAEKAARKEERRPKTLDTDGPWTAVDAVHGENKIMTAGSSCREGGVEAIQVVQVVQDV